MTNIEKELWWYSWKHNLQNYKQSHGLGLFAPTCSTEINAVFVDAFKQNKQDDEMSYNPVYIEVF